MNQVASKPRNFANSYCIQAVLKNRLPERLYKHFLLLHVGIKLLASEKHCFLYNSYAKKLLEKFVRDCGNIYGDHFITYNVHCLVHINADVKRFGPLDKISSFPFENYLQQLKRKVRRGNQPPVQLVKRMAEVDGVDEILNCVSQEQNSQP